MAKEAIPASLGELYTPTMKFVIAIVINVKQVPRKLRDLFT